MTDEMDKDEIHICNGILFSHKEIVPFAASWMGLEIILSEVNQAENDKYNITYMWNLKK